MNIENILIEGTNTLKQSGVSNPQLDCEILLYVYSRREYSG